MKKNNNLRSLNMMLVRALPVAIGLTFFILFSYVFPSVAFADTPFVPCDGGPNNPCGSCEIVSMANTIIQWLIGITFMLFAVLFAIAGFKLVTSGGDTAAKSAAKASLVNALIGLVLILAAWLIVDTLMKALVSGNKEGNGGAKIDGVINGWGPWAEVKCFYQEETVRYEGTVETTYSAAGAGVDPATLGTGNEAVVAFAEQMKAKGCVYDQSRRNACSGTPGYTDCSDLVSTAFKAAGATPPGGTTAALYPAATEIGSKDTLRPGDALVYRYPCDTGTCGHTVICKDVGCNSVIHASGRRTGIKEGNSSSFLAKPGVKVVRVSDHTD